MQDIYVQAELEYAKGKKEVCWILKDIAVPGKIIKVGDKKSEMVFALVQKAYPAIQQTAEEIGINRKYPLRSATDI
jgi:hypothetical protein